MTRTKKSKKKTLLSTSKTKPLSNQVNKLQNKLKRIEQLSSLRTTLLDFVTNHSLKEVLQKTLDELEGITKSQVGFYHFLAPDQKNLSLQAWSTKTVEKFCTTSGEGLHYPIEKAGVWADCVRTGQPIIHNDYQSLPNRKGLPNGHTPVVRELVVPIFRNNKIVAILGLGNKLTDYTKEDLVSVTQLADTVWEVAQRKLTEESLRQQTSRAQLYLETAGAILLALDPQARIVLINAKGCQVLGATREKLLGRNWIDEFIPQAIRKDINMVFSQVMNDETTLAESIENPILTCSGEERLISWHNTVLRDDLGNVIGTLSSGEDVTEIRQVQKEREALVAKLAQSDRLASMGMLAAGVAHEINNPLLYVLYNLETLSEDMGKTTQLLHGFLEEITNRFGKEAIDQILGADNQLFSPNLCEDMLKRVKEALLGTQRIRQISRSLGTFSRVEHAQLSPVNVQQSLEHAITMAFNEIKYRAQLKKDFSKIPPVLASDGKLAQVFLNLLINSAHAIKEGDVKKNQIQIRTWAEADRVLIEVSDTGHGIALENQDKVFEPFFTTKAIGVGSGLGLSICKEIIEGFGGTINFVSRPAQGARFLVSLPKLPDDWVRSGQDLQIKPTDGMATGGRILVVDDEPNIRSAISRMLNINHEVILAASGEEAFTLLKNDRHFDVILCDLMMPALSGMDLHAWLEKEDPTLAKRIVFITGGAFTPGAHHYLAKLGNCHVEKPFDTESFRSLIGKLVFLAKASLDENKTSV